jgi:type I restriction enzyme R subunit
MNESIVEDAALAWLQSIGWLVMHGPELGPDPVDAERQDYGQVVFEERLREALMRLNPTLPVDSTLSSPSGATSSSSFCLTRL